MKSAVVATLLALAASKALAAAHTAPATIGPRPLDLVEQMEDGPLKDKLLSCAAGPFTRTDFSIGHRGAAMQFPEHTTQSYKAAAQMGAGVVECDVTFTKDKQLVCRHSQKDLHTTTNILVSPLARTCAAPFTPAQGGAKASAECRVSDITLAEFRTLTGKMDAANKSATSAEAYQGAATVRTDPFAADRGRLMTHAESISLFASLGVKFMPELKSPVVSMPFNGFSQQDYAQKMIDEYKAVGVPPSDVWAQSFNLEDILYWIKAEPEFGKQAVFLDSRYGSGIDPNRPSTFTPSMAELKALGVNYIAPPMWMLLTTSEGQIAPSAYAIEAKKAGLKLITWTLERSGSLKSGGGWYYQSVAGLIDSDGDVFKVLDVLAQDVGVEGVFSDWPATVTYYANCMGLK